MSGDNPICDKCGKPLLPDVQERGRYTLADDFDEDGRWTVGRHADCHKETADKFRDSMKSFDEASKRVHGLLNELRSKLR